VPRQQPHFKLPPNAAALVFVLDADTSDYPAGCNAHIFPDGAFHADDGRPASITGGELRDWLIDADIAADLIARFEARGKHILYDYEHNSRWGDSRAAGWIDKLEYVAGKGLYAHVEWTPKAADAIAKKEYRYSSPFFSFDPKTGAVKKLISVALTNNPALGDLGGVGLTHDDDTDFSTPEGTDMDPKEVAALTVERDGLKAEVAALTTERDGLKTQLAALTKERDDLNAKVEAAEKDKADAALKADNEKRDQLLKAALDKGVIPPAQKAFAEKLSLAALTEFLEPLTELALLTRQAGDREEGGHGLTAEEQAMCTRLGVKPEDYLKTKRGE
jgi:phage I-like protein